MRDRIVSIALLLLLAAVVLPAAGQGEQQTAQKVKITPPGELPIVEEPVTLSVFIPSVGFIQDMKTNPMAQWVEQETNVKIEWIETSKVDARTKLSVILASGDYPDIIFGCTDSALSKQDVYRYARQGLFLPLTDLIESQGYFIKELFEAEPWVKDAITYPDGEIYSLPAVFTDDYHMTMRQKFWINKAWLDRLGLKMPTTIDEFYAVMKAFKEKDANGNGDPNDEIPMTGAKRHLEDLAMWIMNAFIPAGGQDDSGDALLNCYEFIIDGKVVFTANKPEFREGLRFLRKLYQEGLFDVAALTQDRSQVKPLIEGKVNRIGGYASHHPANMCSLSGDPAAPMHQFTALPPIKGPQGKAHTPWFIDAVIRPVEFVMTNNCEYPEVAFRWADHFYRLETALHDKGVEGVHWAKVDPSENLIAINGEPAKYKYLKPLTPDDNAQINMGPGWTRNLKNEFAKSEGFSYEELLYNATLLYEPYKVRRYPYATASIAEENLTEFIDLRRTIHTYVGEAIDRFIVGDLDVEKDWDAYLKELESLGLPRFMEILEEGYYTSK
ncbi:extracellular solute-binding protein family 1 [Spirochaeta thermophila DSM 6578]|uniref:Extracellular solute-binding protein family 1 n=1 Tax=Winmispira thermophila (strain ATCC 700085 / DSM 6578 / Z-1203) TaxID=869211 RepID=G0GFH4_WINT7|nr:extracellular solute-binding protein [Spirochaeta thermophila]AEJ61588.1 extracellular solute-binding protein family 1 [Spirochaeta thermophila DSM 6578]